MPDPDPPERPESSNRIGGPLAVTALTLGFLTWPIAFNLGAYGEIFFDQLFQVVVASSILLVIVVVNEVYEAPWNWLVRVALAAPLFWLLSAAYVTGSTSEALDRPVFVVSLALIAIVSVPITLRLLVEMAMPELVSTTGHRVTAVIVALVAVLGTIGFVVGHEHPRFLKCEDFKIAGLDQPDNCTP